MESILTRTTMNHRLMLIQWYQVSQNPSTKFTISKLRVRASAEPTYYALKPNLYDCGAVGECHNLLLKCWYRLRLSSGVPIFQVSLESPLIKSYDQQLLDFNFFVVDTSYICIHNRETMVSRYLYLQRNFAGVKLLLNYFLSITLESCRIFA